MTNLHKYMAFIIAGVLLAPPTLAANSIQHDADHYVLLHQYGDARNLIHGVEAAGP